MIRMNNTGLQRTAIYHILVKWLWFVSLVMRSSDNRTINLCPEVKNCTCHIPQALLITCKKMENVTDIITYLHTTLENKTISRVFIRDTDIPVVTNSMFANLSINSLFLYKCRTKKVESQALDSIRGFHVVKIQDGVLTKIPSSVSHLTKLQSLILKRNRIRSFTRQDLKLDSLVHLDLSRNRIDVVGADALKDYSVLVNLILNHNRLKVLHRGTFDDLSQLNYLDLSYNRLTSLSYTFTNINPQTLKINANRLTSLDGILDHAFYKLEFLDFSQNPVGRIQTYDLQFMIPRVTELRLNQMSLTDLPLNVFSDLHQIEHLQLNNNHLTRIEPSTLSPLLGLVYIDLSNNKLNNITRLFTTSKALHTIYLRYNRLMNIHGAFYDLGQLKVLDVRYNSINELSNEDFVGMHKLETLFLCHNRLSKLEDDVFKELWSLRYISMKHNKLTSLGTSLRNFVFLFHIDLNNNLLETLTNETFGISPVIETIEIRSNRLHNIEGAFSGLAKMRYLYLQSNELTTLKRSTFGKYLNFDFINLIRNRWYCDCKLSWFVEFIRKKKGLVIDDADCSAPIDYRGIKLKQLNSTFLSKWKWNCPKMCDCRCIVDDEDSYVATDCSSKMLSKIPSLIPSKSLKLNLRNNRIVNLNKRIDTIPSYQNLKELIVDTNRIVDVNGLKVPSSVKLLSLRDNMITTVDDQTLDSLATTVQQIGLAGNPWICNCNTLALRYWLLQHMSKVADVHNIKCGLDKRNGKLAGKVIINLGTFDLCPEQIIILVTVTGFLGIFLIVAMAKIFYNKYSQHIKIWMYSRGICRCLLCIKPPDDDDQDKRFDAVFFYSTQDYDFVMDEMLRPLSENHPHFNICLHDRHFNPTRAIGDNIMAAIQTSKRIVLILSEHFLESNWCMYEFKTSFFEALRDRVNRILVIVIGDLPQTDELDDDIKMYLETTTYLKYTDVNFWDKLIYAMPRVTREYTAYERCAILMQETGPLECMSDETHPLITDDRPQPLEGQQYVY